MKPAYELSAASISGANGTILLDLNLTFYDQRVTMIVGPGGVGKTTFLRALCPELPLGLTAGGQWRLDGRPREDWGRDEILFSPQCRAGAELARHAGLRTQRARVLLLDEPAATPAGRSLLDSYVELLAEQRARGPALVVTHNLELVRRAADYVVLLCAGSMDCWADARLFLQDPPTALALQFVEQGNCWPRPALPRHFHWIHTNLAGLGRPGLLGDMDDDLAALAAEGIDVLVSLTERRVPQERLSPYGIVGRHLPIADMSIPSLNSAASECREAQRAIERGSRVAFHCEAGLGRTGTMLAAYLVWSGSSAESAIAEVRAKIRGAIQSESQLTFVQRFAAVYGPRL